MKHGLRKASLLFLGLLFFSSLGIAQTVMLKSGGQLWPNNAKEVIADNYIDNDEVVNDYYYRFLQFEHLPDKATQQFLKDKGLLLLQYIPHNVYIAAIPKALPLTVLLNTSIKTILPIDPINKMEDGLQKGIVPEYAISKEDVLVMIQFPANIPHKDILTLCQKDGIKVLMNNGQNNALKAAIKKDKLWQKVNLPYISWIEPVPAPSIPDDILGKSLHRSSRLDSPMPNGRHYTGEGINIQTRDDGDVGPHIDYTGRITNMAGGFGGTHGDGVSGIFTGAGNLDPENRGMAAGAHLYVTDYEASFLDTTLALHLNNNVLVTNSSYSNGCNAGYTVIAQTVDQQMYENPTYMHVFSAGNSNNTDCGYGAGNQWGNITGGHKQGKNVIATANIFADASLVASSSRGPADDGRLKPDISANGQDQVSTDPDNGYAPFGGTSGASPGIAGITTQLHQLYQEKYNEIAPSALLKATLMNTANELGNIGPDFRFGWGHVNGYRAGLLLEEQRFAEGVVSQGDTNLFTLNIPSGVKEAKVMIYWADVPGAVQSAKALVNDLDTWIIDDQNNLAMPWLLDHTPTTAALSSPATKGEDHLNNVEQVSILDPAAGNYTLHIAGTEIPFGDQPYWIVWEFLLDDITVHYPIEGEGVVAGSTVRVHWDAFPTNEAFSIETSMDGGITWTMASTLGVNARMFDWTVPDTYSSQAQVRVSKPSGVTASSGNFMISGEIDDLALITACPDEITLNWSSIPGATSYIVYQLGAKYMDSVMVSVDTFAQIPFTGLGQSWFAVGAMDAQGMKGRRSVAVPINLNGLINCPISKNLELTSLLTPSQSVLADCGTGVAEVAIEITNNGTEARTGFQLIYNTSVGQSSTVTYTDNLNAGESAIYYFDDEINLLGVTDFDINVYIVDPTEIFNLDDSTSFSVESILAYGTPASIDYAQPFNSATALPANWSILNQDNATTWELVDGITGSNGNPTNAMFIDNFGYNSRGEIDYLSSEIIDLSTAVAPFLSLDIAYAPYSATFQDTFAIEISGNCGVSFDRVYYAFGTGLASMPTTTTVFEPTNANQWRSQDVDLAAYLGQDILVRFVSITGYGNQLYIDNFEVFDIAPPTANFSTLSNTPCMQAPVVFQNTSTGNANTYLWNFGVGATPQTSTAAGNVTATYSSEGPKTVQLIVSNPVGADTFTMSLDVQPLATATFNLVTNDNLTITLTNTAVNANSYLWNFGDGNTSTEPNPTHTYATPGDYTIRLTTTNPCGMPFTTQTISVLSNLEDFAIVPDVAISPNPNNGVFSVTIEHTLDDSAFDLSLFNNLGQQVYTVKVQGDKLITHQVEQPSLAKGTYHLVIKQGSKGLTRKIIIQ